MRKHRDDDAELEIEFFRVKVKGGNSTVEEAIRHAANVALGRAVNNRRNEAPALPAGKNNDKPDSQQSLDFDSVEEGEVVDNVSNTKSTPAKSGSNKPKDKRIYPTPEVLHDLDLKGGKVSFESFCKSKNPNGDNKKYLVIATWFKEHANVNAITPAHIYTCYRAMSWSDYPTDWKQPFRNCKSQGWFKSASTASWEINHLGLEVVNKMAGGS